VCILIHGINFHPQSAGVGKWSTDSLPQGTKSVLPRIGHEVIICTRMHEDRPKKLAGPAGRRHGAKHLFEIFQQRSLNENCK
jgi:hypothetical protein